MINYERQSRPESAGMRPDISRAIDALPANIKQQVTGEGTQCLQLASTHLASDEEVRHISSAAAMQGNPNNCLLILTDRRLIFVAPAPQAVGWKLSTISRSQAYSGYFFVEGDAGDYSLGLDDSWGSTFESHVKHAIAVAVLSGG